MLFMKQIIFIFGCVVIMLSGCEPKASETACSGDCCMAMKDSVEIIMNIPVKLKPESIDAYKAAFEKCRTETLKEEACMAYDLFQSYKDSTEFHLFERWKNKPGHLAHMETPHIKVYFEEIRGMQDRAATRMIEVAVCPKLNP
jgi:quinol monooxygenase YgiN